MDNTTPRHCKRVTHDHGRAYRSLVEQGLCEGRDFTLLPSLELVRIYTTSFCNAACAMCDIGAARDQGIDRLRKSDLPEMPLSTLERLLNMPSVKDRRLKFSLGMVEPLLHSDIGGMVGRIKAGGHSVAVITNGILLEKKARQLTDNAVDFVTVSIDGPEAVHDATRGRAGIYRKAVNGIKALHECAPSLPVFVNCAVCNLNQHTLYELARGLDDEGLRVTLQFQHLYFVTESMAADHNARTGDTSLHQTWSTVSDALAPEQVDAAALWEEMKGIDRMTPGTLKSIRFRPVFDSLEGLRAYYKSGGTRIAGYDRCLFPYNQISIKTNGDALFHSRCFDYILGNLHEEEVGAVFHGERAEHFRALLRAHDYCFPACTRCCGIMGGWQL